MITLLTNVHKIRVVVCFHVIHDVGVVKHIQNSYLLHHGFNVVGHLGLVKNFDGYLYRRVVFVEGLEHLAELALTQHLRGLVNHVVLLKLYYALLLSAFVDRDPH